MSSIIPGYEYDIFISYRQKDNKGDRWVSEFAEALKTELESTFKEEVSVYFDINPHDGLLETHDVDASLKEKLKCLVFIPIISRTYCDPKSFAWEYEFKAFVEQASQDQFGLKIKLPNGNIANRVLPIRIHDLDIADIKEYESVLGGVLRGIEFIYKELGVNKPLTADDDEKKNLNNTKYRIQINKTANAVKEIIAGLKKEPIESFSKRKEALSTEDKPLIKEKSIIVLPFENISPDPDQEYFSDGLTEEIITDLSHIRDLLVISRSSAMTFKGTKSTIKEITDKVNVRYVLEGSVRKAGQNLRITAQLIDAANDTHLWADKYTGTLDDIFEIQEKVSRAIVEEIQVKLTRHEQARLTSIRRVIPEAYEDYLKGRQGVQKWTRDEHEKSIAHFEQSIQKDADYAPSYAALAECYCWLAMWGMNPPRPFFSKAKAAVAKALKLDGTLAQAHAVMGSIHWQFDWDFAAAEKESKQAVDLNPGNANVRFLYGLFLNATGRSDECVSELIIGQRLDPVSPEVSLQLAMGYFFARQYDQAISQFKEAIHLDPSSALAHSLLAVNYARNGMYTEAISTGQKASELLYPGTDIMVDLFLADAYFISNRPSDSQNLLELWEQIAGKCYVDPTHMSSLNLALDRRGRAFEWLNRAFEERSPLLPAIKSVPIYFDKLGSDARYHALLKRIGYQ
jgi:TolB-like protein/cytochrome c-type biogenesis protein CcmH/NrfG